ncbi:MAG: hypothetical protein LUB61_00115 [Eggerthellaceae bacterium]|nr:hypothetical protein [Eggerthellaceae bacterium]
MKQTARAFGVDAPKTSGLSHPELLRRYAEFTADEAQRALANGYDLERLHDDIYGMAYRLGSRVRWWLNPQNDQECLEVMAMLYRNIGITICEEAPRRFCVKKCYFSEFYSPEVCAVISALDQGIFAGIYRGGSLEFSGRITEGKKVCRADLL